MWGSLCVISVLFAYFLVPETKGLSLEQVDELYGKLPAYSLTPLARSDENV